MRRKSNRTKPAGIPAAALFADRSYHGNLPKEKAPESEGAYYSSERWDPINRCWVEMRFPVPNEKEAA